MTSDQNDRDELHQSNDEPIVAPIEDTGGVVDESPPTAEDALDAVFDPLMKQLQPDELQDSPPVQEPGETLAEPSDAVLPVDRPGASATTGTGTSIALGCTAVCAVILLITILILTIVS